MNARLKIARIRSGLLQKDVAEKVGISERSYSNYESESRKPTIEVAIKIAKTVNKTVEEIFAKDDVDNAETKRDTCG